MEQLQPGQIHFYSACSQNPIFNDIASAVLSEAICLCWGIDYLTKRSIRSPAKYSHAYPHDFWMALCACVLGDLHLFESHASKLAWFSKCHLSRISTDDNIISQLSAFLTVAIHKEKLCIIKLLLQICSESLPDIFEAHTILQAAIQSNNEEIVGLILRNTPKSSELLIGALNTSNTLFARSGSASEIIRLLASHFAPLSAPARSHLILQSCAAGDAELLEEFSRSAPLFQHRISDAGGRHPTYAHYAVRRGNVDCLRVLIDHGLFNHGHSYALRMATEMALIFNHIDCYRELYNRFDSDHMIAPRSIFFFQHLGAVEHAEDVITEHILRDKEELFDSFNEWQPSCMQRALYRAIQHLRYRNIALLLEAGTWLFPWSQPKSWIWGQAKNPFKIRWSTYTRDRNAFQRSQVVLDAYDLPKLKLVV